MSSKMDDKTIDDVIRIASALKDIIDNSSPDTWTLLCAISLAMIDGPGTRCKPQPELKRTKGDDDAHAYARYNDNYNLTVGNEY